MTNQLILSLQNLQVAMPRDFGFSFTSGTSESHDSIVFISLIQSLYKTSLWTSIQKSWKAAHIAPSVCLLSASDPRLVSNTQALGWSGDRADLIKFADGESDDYSAGRKEREEEGKEDNENNCRGLNTPPPLLPPPPPHDHHQLHHCNHHQIH